MEAKNLLVDWWLLNDTRGMGENTHTLTFHPQRPVPLLLSFPRSKSTGDADEDLLGRGVLRTVMILASSSSGHPIQLVRFSCITRINLKKPKVMFLMGKSRATGETADDLCIQEICCAFPKSAWVTECKVSLGSSWRQGFIQHFSFVIGLRVANFCPSSISSWKMHIYIRTYIYICASVASSQGYSGTFLLRTTLKVTWQLRRVPTPLEMCLYSRHEQVQHVFVSHGVLNSVCFCFPVCFDQQNLLSKRIYFYPCQSLPRCVAQRGGFPEVAVLVSWDHWLQLTLSYLLLKENPKMYCAI